MQMTKSMYINFVVIIEETKQWQIKLSLIKSTILTIVLLTLNILTIQYLTYVDFKKIFIKTEDENINRSNFFRALFANITLYALSALIYFLYYFRNPTLPMILSFANSSFIQEYVVLLFIFPGILSMLINKFIYYKFFTIRSIEGQHMQSNYSAWKQLFFHIDFTCLKRNGMAQMFLYRTYNTTISMTISLILFIVYSNYSAFFAKPVSVSFLIYSSTNLFRLKVLNWFLTVNVVYSFFSLIDFYYFPTFSIRKQIYDSLFLLNDDKLLLAGAKVGETCEKSVLESFFINQYINFDQQSKYYYVDSEGKSGNEIFNNCITTVN